MPVGLTCCREVSARMQGRRRRVARTLLAALGLACVPAQAVVMSFGPATYTVTTTIVEDRGTAPPAFGTRAVHAYAGAGQSQASGGAISTVAGPGFISDNAPTTATGVSTNTTLRALSRVTGETSFPAALGDPLPSVRAHTRSENVRRYVFSNPIDPTATTVPLDFSYALDGYMLAGIANEVPGAFNLVSVGFGVRVTDAASGSGTTVFETRAAMDRTGILVPNRTSTAGVAVLADWLDAITPRTIDPPSAFLTGVDVNYIGSFLSAFQAPVGRELEVNWFLETESSMQGSAIIDALLESNFRDTAEVGIAVGAGAPGAIFEEILSIPPQSNALSAPGTLGWVAIGGLLACLRRWRATAPSSAAGPASASTAS